MKTARIPRAAPAPALELAELRARLAEAEETLRAIGAGEVDAVVITRNRGPQVFSLQGAERAYRVLIESMNEGALTLTKDKTILYANQSFARMVKCPLEQVIGDSFRRFISPADRVVLRALFAEHGKAGAKIQLQLNGGEDSHLPVQISLRPLARKGFDAVTYGMVVTDMSETRRTEDLMRALNHRVVQVQETERARVASELHDHITQLLCAILFRCQALVDELSARDGPSLREAVRLREMLGQTAAEVERITRNLRPGVLDQLGLRAVLRATGAEFTERTGVPVELDYATLAEPLSADRELALYRIFQEAMKNVERHSRARHVNVQLSAQGDLVQLTIRDDGIGFNAEGRPAALKPNPRLGLLGMRERALFVGGTFTIKSTRRAGTEIEVRIPRDGTATA